MNKIAIIDQGTSSSKLFIFDISNSTPELIIKEKGETRLGEGMEESGVVSEESLIRTIKVLNNFKKIIEDLDVRKTKVISTEVMRKAENREEVKEILLKKTGFPIDVLEQIDESRVFWHGITNDFNWDKNLAAIDIGGGSVEFMWGKKDKLEGYRLLKTGALTLRERFIKEPPKDKDYDQIENFIRKELEDLDVFLGEETPLIHGSTSVLDFYNEAKIPMKDFSYSKAHPKKTILTDTRDFYLKTRNYNKEERARLFPSYPEFMDGVYVGLANVLITAEITGIKYELPSNNNIMHGIILLMQNNEFDDFLGKQM